MLVFPGIVSGVLFPTMCSILSVIYVTLYFTSGETTPRLYGSVEGKQNYSYIGDDFPPLLDVNLTQVEMTYEETVHYQLGDRTSHLEWLSLRVPWGHMGYVRRGPEDRVFAVALFHQMHCVDMLARGVSDAQDTDAAPHHIQHCLNYLRQLFLCSADITLEPYDFLDRNYSSHAVGVTRTCRNWEAIYAATDKNYRGWRAIV